MTAKEYDFSACWNTTKGVSSLMASFIKRYGEKNPSAEKAKKWLEDSSTVSVWTEGEQMLKYDFD